MSETLPCPEAQCDRRADHPGSHRARCFSTDATGRCNDPAGHHGVHTTGYAGWGWYQQPDPIETMLGIDPNDPLEQMAAEVVRLRASIKALADDMDERGKPGPSDSETDRISRRQVREDAKRVRALLPEEPTDV